MDAGNSNNRVYVRRLRRQSKRELTRLAIILSFVLVTTLVSIWLPVYFALLPLKGG